jgi:chromate transport protein ChrA
VTDASQEPTPPPIGYAALFLRFLRFGMLAFGGPVAQIAMIRRALVEEQRWISSERFNRLLAASVLQLGVSTWDRVPAPAWAAALLLAALVAIYAWSSRYAEPAILLAAALIGAAVF